MQRRMTLRRGVKQKTLEQNADHRTAEHDAESKQRHQPEFRHVLRIEVPRDRRKGQKREKNIQSQPGEPPQIVRPDHSKTDRPGSKCKNQKGLKNRLEDL